jgi:hypothetical protein
MTDAATARIACVVLLFGGVPAVPAAELRVDGTASTYAEFNDNPRLVEGDADPVVGAVVDATMSVRWGAPPWQWDLVPRVVARNYTGDYNLDSRDVYLTGGYTRSSERGQVQLGGSYARQSTLTSEFSSTGVVEDNVPSETLGAQIAAQHNVTERVTLSGQLAYSDVSYEQGLRYGLLDYEYLSAAGFTRYSLTERTSVRFVARFARLDVPVTGGWSRETTLGLGVEHAWSERWRLDVAAGPSFSDFAVGDSSQGVSYRLGLSGDWEKARLDFGAERLLSPIAGQGRLQTRDALRASLVYRMRETLDLRTWISADQYSDVGDRLAGIRDDTGTTRAGVGLTWRASPDWSLRTSYTYSRRYGDISPDGNLVSAGVTWHGWSHSSSH